MTTITLRGGIEIQNQLEVALQFLGSYRSYEVGESSGPRSFDERDLRRANRGGARISAAQIAAILERRSQIERSLRAIPADASLAAAPGSIPWRPLTELFEAFGDMRGVGFSKMTKALHPKRPALIPMLDSVIQAYLTRSEPEAASAGSFAERAVAFVRSYKRDLDRNRPALREVKRELAKQGYITTELRILDLLIWSAEEQVKRH